MDIKSPFTLPFNISFNSFLHFDFNDIFLKKPFTLANSSILSLAFKALALLKSIFGFSFLSLEMLAETPNNLSIKVLSNSLKYFTMLSL